MPVQKQSGNLFKAPHIFNFYIFSTFSITKYAIISMKENADPFV